MAPDAPDAPDVSSSQSACPLCGASAARDASACMACGQPLRALAPMRVVEAAPPTLGEQLGERVMTLASAAWRQPAVRSAAVTGASAVALSLVWRVAGAALHAGRARRLLASQMADESLAPMVGELLRGATPARRPQRGRRGRRGEIVEEMIYVRRIYRR